MTMAGLFSGGGGFELASLWAGIEPIWSNDIDDFCCQVMKKNFSHEIIHESITNIETNELTPVDIICGGDPCQPNSNAGLGKGQNDHRYLWPQMLRIIRALRPLAVVNENVVGSISNGILDIKINDLENQGYTCQTYILPAEAVGAFHRRDRVWLVAINPHGCLKNRKARNIQGESQKKELQKQQETQHNSQPVDLWPVDTYHNIQRFEKQHYDTESNPLSEGVSRYFGFGASANGHLPRNIAKSGIMRMLNGLPEGMDYAHRNKRIAIMGNAIPPQAAYEILLAIKNYYDT